MLNVIGGLDRPDEGDVDVGGYDIDAMSDNELIDFRKQHIGFVFQAYNLKEKRFMEYVEDHGVYADIPLKTILTAWEKAYGRERVQDWIRLFETNGHSRRDFSTETVVSP